MPSPIDRSRAALPANIRKTLEESNLPVEVATAIADLCEGLLPPEGGVASIRRFVMTGGGALSVNAVEDPNGAWVLYADVIRDCRRTACPAAGEEHRK